MSKRTTTALQELVKCMSRAEKRSFSVQTNSKKLMMLFNAVKENKSFPDKQVHNLKSELYKKLLDCIKSNEVEEKLHKGIEQAKILYDKKLYLQSYKTICKVKMLARGYHQVSFQFQALVLEKKIRALHIIVNGNKDIWRLQQESAEISSELSAINYYSLQSLLMYDQYARWGSLAQFPEIDLDRAACGFYSKMYKLQCLVYLTIINGNEHTKYALELCEHFEKMPYMKLLEPEQYEKAKLFLQKNVHVPMTVLKDDPVIINNHFNYAKSLYNERNYDKALDYLIPIINSKLFFRIDLQIQAREIHLACHRALGNDEIVPSLESSLKRFEKNIKSLLISPVGAYMLK